MKGTVVITLQDLAKSLADGRPGLYIRGMGADVINIGGGRRELIPADVEDVREALTSAGYVEVKSWIATEGMSWLSDGVQSVSFRIRPADEAV